MSKQNSIPKKDVDFNVAQNNIVTTANKHRQDWELNTVWINSDLMPKKADWETAWEAYLNPTTRNPTLTFIKTEKRKVYEKSLRILVKNLQSNVHVTPDDLRGMGIVVPSTSRTPAPMATTYPAYSIDSSTIRRLIIHFYDQILGQGTGKSNAKPAGQHGVEIRWVISDTPIVDMSMLPNSSFDTHTPFTLEFEGHDRGKTVYFCLRWENTRGEKGPWSEIQSAIIP
ncbi:MAG: hypothetical protein LBL13_09880 [Bacteroidales bacterium]|jgi:hypothetical protein|nr:hypothetical protein [Bacteroidales bacterium]